MAEELARPRRPVFAEESLPTRGKAIEAQRREIVAFQSQRPADSAGRHYVALSRGVLEDGCHRPPQAGPGPDARFKVEQTIPTPLAIPRLVSHPSNN